MRGRGRKTYTKENKGCHKLTLSVPKYSCKDPKKYVYICGWKTVFSLWPKLFIKVNENVAKWPFETVHFFYNLLPEGVGVLIIFLIIFVENPEGVWIFSGTTQ